MVQGSARSGLYHGVLRMSLPRISVIMPCLNQSNFVERALCSVLDQGYEDLELIVLDGGSTDGSVELICRYEADLAFFKTETDAGPADALNQGLARATGQIVAFLNADDLYLPGALHAAAKAFASPDTAWAVGQCVRIGPLDQHCGRLGAEAPPSLAAFLMHDAGVLPWPASFFRRELFTQYGGLDGELQFAFDYEWACRLLAAGLRPALVPQVLAARREYGHSRTAQNLVIKGREYVAAANRYADCLPLAQRYALWRNCDRRQRIYALAEAEVRGREARRFLAPCLLRRPWWMADDSLRHALLHGVDHPLPEHLARPAA